MSTNWKAGDKAVCVDDSPSDKGFHLLKRGVIYLVEDVREAIHFPGEIALHISGIDLGFNQHYGVTNGWRAKRFRKLVTATERADRREREFKEMTNLRAAIDRYHALEHARQKLLREIS